MPGRKGRSGGARGKSGFPRSALTALTKPERAALDRIAAQHGYIVANGSREGQGNAVEMMLSLISGELTTLLIDAEERRWFVEWLERQPVDDPLYEDVPRQVAAQIRAAIQREHDRQMNEK